MKKFLSRVIYSILLIFLLAGCKSNNFSNDRFYLNDNWEYSEFGAPYENIPLPDQNLDKLSKLLSDKHGYIFLKQSFTLPKNLKYKEIYFFLGRVKIAAKVYINDHYLGHTGFFPPHEFTEGEKSGYFKIPKEYLNYDGENIVKICVWCNEYGTLKDKPFISNSDDVIHKAEFNNLINSKIYMIFSVVLLIVFLIYFFLFILRRTALENLSFSQMCLSTAFYLVTFYIGEYSIIYQHIYSFLLFEKIFNGAAPILTCYFVINFTRDFLKYNENQKSRLFRFLISIVAVALPFFGRNLSTSRLLLRFSFYIMIFQFVFPTKIVIQGLLKKESQAFVFILCFIPIYIMLIVQFIYRIVLNKPPMLLFLSIGWLIVIFLFLGLLIYNFVQLSKKVEYMNKNLEKLVEERTEALQQEKERAVKEIELAAFVQQSFFKLDTQNISDWDLNFFSKPMAGVSGDLYLAFKTNNTLEGIGIFDISGHGIASGLVTMLVKNIIEKEFHKGRNKSLAEVLTVINDRIIFEKGNIENYLTGILIRITDNKLEIVNAGHPKALLYKAKQDEITFVDKEGVNQYGAIGIDGFPVNFQSFTFEMDSGDELILYTDGITEADNSDGKYFGTQGIIDTINANKKAPLDQQVSEIYNSLTAFTNKKNLDDDITYVILRKK